MFRVVDLSLPQAPMPGGVHGMPLGRGWVGRAWADCVQQTGASARSSAILLSSEPRSLCGACPLPLSTCGGIVQISMC